MGLIDRLLSPDFTISHNVRASSQQGPAAFREVCGAFFTAFPDLQVRLQDVFGAGDRVAAELLVGGTNTGDWLGHPPTGRRVAYKAIALVTVAGERITHLELLDDYSSILQQLGLVVMPEVSRH
jgi:predicted ester cyclase